MKKAKIEAKKAIKTGCKGLLTFGKDKRSNEQKTGLKSL